MFFRKHAPVLAPSLLAMLAAISSVGCAVAAGDDPESTGHAEQAITSLTGTFVLQIEGKCLESPNWAVANGTPVDIWDCNGGSNQAWVLGADGTIRPSFDSNVCLELPDWQTADGTKLDLWSCNGGSNQKWTVANNTIVGYGGKCIDNPGWNTNDGTDFDYWDCNGGTNQQILPLVERVTKTFNLSLGSSVQGTAYFNLLSDGAVQFEPSATNSNQATGYDYQWVCAAEDTNGTAYTVAYSGNVSNSPFNAFQGTHTTNNPGWQTSTNQAVVTNWGAILDGWNRGQVQCTFSATPTWESTISNIISTIGSDLGTVLGWIEQYGPTVVSTVTLIAAST